MTSTNPIGPTGPVDLGRSLPSGTLPTIERQPALRDDVLDIAKQAISTDRAATYGDAEASFTQVAKIWSIILDTEDQPVSALDVAMCLAALKLVRQGSSPQHLDNYVDLAGYTALAAEIAGAE